MGGVFTVNTPGLVSLQKFDFVPDDCGTLISSKNRKKVNFFLFHQLDTCPSMHCGAATTVALRANLC